MSLPDEPVNESSDQAIRTIVVLGGGSAGFLAALALKKHLSWANVVVVRSTKMGVIGVGEGTIVSVVNFLHGFLEIDPTEFMQRSRASLKLGIRYLWGKRNQFFYTFDQEFTAPVPGSDIPRGYHCDDDCEFVGPVSALMANDKACIRHSNGRPALGNSYAYHLENETFVHYLEELADRAGIQKIDDVVASTSLGENGIEALHLESGAKVEGDLYLDCSGFRSELLGKALEEPFDDFSDSLFCDGAIVGGWERTDEDIYHPYTTAETMDHGWAW